MVKFLVPIIFILISGLLSSSLVDCSDLKSLFMVFRHGERMFNLIIKFKIVSTNSKT